MIRRLKLAFTPPPETEEAAAREFSAAYKQALENPGKVIRTIFSNGHEMDVVCPPRAVIPNQRSKPA